jgi:hypothetical protein
MSHELVATLPYLAVQLMEFGPISPLRFIPRGKVHTAAGKHRIFRSEIQALVEKSAGGNSVSVRVRP